MRPTVPPERPSAAGPGCVRNVIAGRRSGVPAVAPAVRNGRPEPGGRVVVVGGLRPAQRYEVERDPAPLQPVQQAGQLLGGARGDEEPHAVPRQGDRSRPGRREPAEHLVPRLRGDVERVRVFQGRRDP